MAKKKIKPKAGTLAAFWEKIKAAAPVYSQSPKSKIKQSIAEIQKIAEEFNSSSVPVSIASNFINPYIADVECRVFLEMDTGRKSFKPARHLNSDGAHSMAIDPIGIYNYIMSFKLAGKAIVESPRISEDFKEFRMISFMHAVSRLPEPYFFYIAVLQEMAVANDIVSVENRDGGYTKSDASSYLSMLWAFKEFERFYLRIQHRSLRADYAVIWHEGEWVQERRTRGYA
ncbi:MAG: hypothetical protein JW808_03575 [Victivallales bacterium]|nr:hypothetical protein [Victivallales bacterium]